MNTLNFKSDGETPAGMTGIRNNNKIRSRLFYIVLSVAILSSSLFTSSHVSAAPSMYVASPNGGEDWARGSTHTISWTSSGFSGNVKIKLLKAGSVYRVLTSTTANDGSFTWTVPSGQSLGTNYKIRVQSVSNSAIRDQSNANFQISTGGSLAVSVEAPPVVSTGGWSGVVTDVNLYTEGTKIMRDGKEIFLRSLTVSTNNREKNDQKQSPADTVYDTWFQQEDIAHMKSLGLNMVEIHMIALSAVSNDDGSINTEYFNNWIDNWVKWCTEEEMYAVINYQRLNPTRASFRLHRHHRT